MDDVRLTDIRYHAADTHITNVCVCIRNDEVQGVTGSVGWTDNVLGAAERMQQLCQAYSMWIVCLVDVYIEVATDNDWMT